MRRKPRAAPKGRWSRLDTSVAEAVLGIDTLWGGDVMNPSGTGRFIADSWFSDQRLPRAYTHEAARAVRAAGGVGAKVVDRRAIEDYLQAVDLPGAISGISEGAEARDALRKAYLKGLASCFRVMFDLAMEILGKGEAVPYERCVKAATGKPPEPSDPAGKVRALCSLLERKGFDVRDSSTLLRAVDRWRGERLVPRKSIPSIAQALIAEFDALSGRHLSPFLPASLAKVPRANIRFLPIDDAWFSGSMNYLGRARRRDGSPEYEATYEINSKLEISVPEFQQLVSHEVVPGHVTTFAYLQNLFFRGKVGFEASVLTMNTRAAALFEGIANNAILIAHGVGDVDDLPDEDLQIGVLLALLQDDAKNQSSYLTWKEGRPKEEVASLLRREYLVSPERADKLSGAWGRHPLLGRMYLPLYRFGTRKVAALRRRHPPHRILPALFGCRGLVDVVTVEKAVA